MLDEKTKDRIYARIYRRFSRLGKKLKKNFKEVSINGKYFPEALEREFEREQQLSELGKSPSHFAPSRDTERRSPNRKSPYDWLSNPSDKKGVHSEKCRCPACEGGFSDPDLIGRIPESDERKAEREGIAQEFNELSEAFATASVCSRCKSSVCRCGENENE